ncbi:MAG: beta-N-acetylhexosaminidase [Bacteroidales bacterium]
MKLFFMLLCISLSVYASAPAIIPQPNQMIVSEGHFLVGKHTQLYIKGCEADAQFLKNFLSNEIKEAKKQPRKNFIALLCDPSFATGDEGYQLDITKVGITLKARNSQGIFYGIQTLLQLAPVDIYKGLTPSEVAFPLVSVKDEPMYAWRGMMLDVSRQFFNKEFIKRYLDWMAVHKLNKFHWHLTDDNGWRLEIKKYPELTSKGAWRGPDEVLPPAYGSGKKRYGGFYTQEDVREILTHAKKLHIEVIPEIDLPGHSKAVTATYPEIMCTVVDTSMSINGENRNLWCVGREQNYKILEGIIAEVAALFPSSYIHVGGDEVNPSPWKRCDRCQALMKAQNFKSELQLENFFMKRMEKIVGKYGKTMAGWNEIINGGDINPQTLVFAWQSPKHGAKALNRNFETIMMPGAFCYLDMQQSPTERGHNWAGIVTLEKAYSYDPQQTEEVEEGKLSRIKGVQGALWSESLDKPFRFVEYQTYPRLCALAEVGWTKPENKDYNKFYERLYSKHLDRLTNIGVQFRLNPPVVKLVDKYIQALAPYRGIPVYYTTDGTEPTEKSAVYRSPLSYDKEKEYRFRSYYKGSRSPVVQPEGVERAPYLNPKVTITSSLDERKRFELSLLKDNNPNTYFRSERPCVEGDWILFSYAEPLSCSKIEIETGLQNISRYVMTDGYVTVSYDGETFTKGVELQDGILELRLDSKKPIKALKIVVTRHNDDPLVAVKDLRIIP